MEHLKDWKQSFYNMKMILLKTLICSLIILVPYLLVGIMLGMNFNVSNWSWWAIGAYIYLVYWLIENIKMIKLK